ncbi:MAG: GC-type dockerin domain-anchored protein, partial [Planctomycetota bacterium]|nr:GC-type dockerin domain-anchored protein [Planctomycetota bacterium]
GIITLEDTTICNNRDSGVAGDDAQISLWTSGVLDDQGGNCLAGDCGTCATTDQGSGGCPPDAGCPSDLNGDAIVDGVDLGMVLGAWGSHPGSADITGDGTVDAHDLAYLLAAWGDSCNEVPCPPEPLPSLPAVIANSTTGQITDHFVSCTTGVTYLGSGLRTAFMTGGPDYLRIHSEPALGAIVNQDAMATAVCETLQPPPQTCSGSSFDIPVYPGCQLAGNAITLWTQDQPTMQVTYPTDDDPDGSYGYPYYKLVQWALAVDFQFTGGWSDALISATAVLEAQLATPINGCEAVREAPAQTLYRGATVLPDEFARLVVGESLYVRGFWATTPDEQVAQGYVDGADSQLPVQHVLFEIDYQNGTYPGYDIAPMSVVSSEAEILFPPYVNFTVLEISEEIPVPGRPSYRKVTVRID